MTRVYPYLLTVVAGAWVAIAQPPGGLVKNIVQWIPDWLTWPSSKLITIVAFAVLPSFAMRHYFGVQAQCIYVMACVVGWAIGELLS